MSKYGDFEISSIYAKTVKYLLVVSIVLFSLFYSNVSYALGFVLGGVASLVNFSLMAKSLEGMISKSTYSKVFFNGNILLRHILVLAVLLSALMLESVNLVTTVVGILSIKIVITWEVIKNYIKSNKNPE